MYKSSDIDRLLAVMPVCICPSYSYTDLVIRINE